ncbi:hypothetical protein BJ138DRAFT_1117624 [Hygrophoropsis aurantiaca]|uniref:Uncharacterized protein n=1 Tax=Hygrophoropsis aurantiaca TaxID=72124 RepID=A0ACB7ZZ13_9AGAM|nr:hypothetical protein BJ138DRAFT_1117624 [Hygrophoropsis aurantiaca]
MPPLRERNLVESCMQVLSPHFHRCRTIRISVTFRSSLPQLPHHFCGSAPDLANLRIDCKLNNAVPDSWFSNSAEWSFSSKRVNKMHVDSIYFREAWFCKFSWSALPLLCKLTISRGSPSADQDDTSEQTLSRLMVFVSPKLQRDQLRPSPSKGSLSMTAQQANDITRTSVEVIYQLLNLRLHNLAPSFDFSTFLSAIHVHSLRRLTMCNCPSFTDDVVVGTDWKVFHRLQSLTVIDCAKVTPSAFKFLLKTIYLNCAQYGHGDRSKPPKNSARENPLKTLVVVGGARISATKQRWFESRVMNFDWRAALGNHEPSVFVDSDGE